MYAYIYIHVRVYTHIRVCIPVNSGQFLDAPAPCPVTSEDLPSSSAKHTMALLQLDPSVLRPEAWLAYLKEKLNPGRILSTSFGPKKVRVLVESPGSPKG